MPDKFEEKAAVFQKMYEVMIVFTTRIAHVLALVLYTKRTGYIL